MSRMRRSYEFFCVLGLGICPPEKARCADLPPHVHVTRAQIDSGLAQGELVRLWANVYRRTARAGERAHSMLDVWKQSRSGKDGPIVWQVIP